MPICPCLASVRREGNPNLNCLESVKYENTRASNFHPCFCISYNDFHKVINLEFKPVQKSSSHFQAKLLNGQVYTCLLHCCHCPLIKSCFSSPQWLGWKSNPGLSWPSVCRTEQVKLVISRKHVLFTSLIILKSFLCTFSSLDTSFFEHERPDW